MNKIFLVLSLILLPFYIFPSGLPQPAHMFMGLFIIGVLFEKKSISGNDKAIIFIYSIFTAYVFIVQGIYVLHSSDFSPE